MTTSIGASDYSQIHTWILIIDDNVFAPKNLAPDQRLRTADWLIVGRMQTEYGGWSRGFRMAPFQFFTGFRIARFQFFIGHDNLMRLHVR